MLFRSVSICSPGEYEVGDFSIKGIAAQRHIDSTETNKRSVIYKVEVGDIHIAVLGNIAPAITDNQLEDLGVIDILIIPVGGSGYTLDATSAVNIIRQIEPKIVVPVHYGEVADVPDRGLDVEVVTQVPRDRADLVRRLDDDELLGHVEPSSLTWGRRRELRHVRRTSPRKRL